MSRRLQKRLEDHIRRTGRYEPLVVRPHPSRVGSYQILNGRHRLKVLRHIGQTRAACIVWDVDDGEALVLLATLNRLAGRDALTAKTELIAALARRFNMDRLSAMLPDTRAAIERLLNLTRPQAAVRREPSPEPYLHSLVLFLTSEEKRIVDRALHDAGRTIKDTPGRRKARVLVGWAQGNGPSAPARPEQEARAAT